MENNINYAALTLDEIIFIGRNKEYGAYDLRQSYDRNIKRAILGTIFITAMAMSYQSIYAMIHPLTVEAHKEVTVTTTEIKALPKPSAVIPSKPEMPKQGHENAATAVLADKKPVSDNQADTAVLAPVPADVEIASVANASGTKGLTSGREDGHDIVETPKAAPPVLNSVFTVVEKMPEFPGGENALMKYVGSHISYPEYDMSMGIHGKALVGFVINEQGKVTEAKMVRSISPGIDREALRVIRSLPDFSPGEQSGRKVKVSFVIPIVFSPAND